MLQHESVAPCCGVVTQRSCTHCCLHGSAHVAVLITGKADALELDQSYPTDTALNVASWGKVT